MNLYYDELYYFLGQQRKVDLDFYKTWVKQAERKRVLDLGGGYGRLAKEFIQDDICDQITVVDKERWMVEKCGDIAEIHGLDSRIEAIQGDVTEPLDEYLALNWFDCAICAHNMVNELLTENALKSLLSNVSRHLERNGLCILDTYVVNQQYPTKVVEHLDTFSQGDDLLNVTTMMERTEEDISRYTLHFYYERFCGQTQESLKRWMRILHRKDWNPEHIIEQAKEYDLHLLERVSEPFGSKGQLALILQKSA